MTNILTRETMERCNLRGEGGGGVVRDSGFRVWGFIGA